MAATVEGFTAMMRSLAEGLHQQQQHHQQQNQLMSQLAARIVDMEERGQKMMQEVTKPRNKHWDDINLFKNVKVFSGEPREWEEFANKMKGQISATMKDVCELMDFVETKMAESDVKADDYEKTIEDEYFMKREEVTALTAKLHNLLLNLTTRDANGVVRRCRGLHGLLAWKRLCTDLNPRTLASGIKMISQAMNPPKIIDSKKADITIDTWEDKLDTQSAEC